MVTITPEKSISLAKASIATQRESVAKQRTEAEEAKRILELQKSKLPKITQSSLRSGNLSGLNGLRRRASIYQAGKGIQEKEGKVNVLMNELIRYEREELEPYEKDVLAYEKALKQYYKDTEALGRAEERARALYSSSSSSKSSSSKVVSPSYVFKSQTPSKITLPSSILSSSKSSNVSNSSKKKSIFSWRK